MGRYLDLAKSIHTTKHNTTSTESLTGDCELSEISEISPRVTTVVASAPLRDRAFTVLVRIHAEHEARVQGRRIALIPMEDWRESLGLDELQFRRIVIELEESAQIIRERGSARPATGLRS